MEAVSPVDYRGLLTGNVNNLASSIYFDQKIMAKMSEEKQEEYVINHFSSTLMKMLFNSMRKSVNKEDGLMGSSFVNDMYTQMLDEGLSLAAASDNYLKTLGTSIKKQLQKTTPHSETAAGSKINLKA